MAKTGKEEEWRFGSIPDDLHSVVNHRDMNHGTQDVIRRAMSHAIRAMSRRVMIDTSLRIAPHRRRTRTAEASIRLITHRQWDILGSMDTIHTSSHPTEHRLGTTMVKFV